MSGKIKEEEEKKEEKNRRKGKSSMVLQSATSGSLKHSSCLNQKICIVFLAWRLF